MCGRYIYNTIHMSSTIKYIVSSMLSPMVQYFVEIASNILGTACLFMSYDDITLHYLSLILNFNFNLKLTRRSNFV